MKASDRPPLRPGGAEYLPSLAEIAEATARIRAGWTRRVFFERAGIDPRSLRVVVNVVRAADLAADRPWEG